MLVGAVNLSTIRVVFLALLLLYDVTNKTSFDNIRAWLGEIREYAQDDVVIMLLGKSNLEVYLL
jgi:L-lactate permease